MQICNGVDLGKVDKVHLARIAAQLGAKVPPGATSQRLVEEVGKIFDRTPASLAGPCDNCGGMSDSSLTECPFCGIGEGDDDEEDEPATPSLALAAPASVAIAATTGERKLDDALARIEAIKAGVMVSLWGIGKQIKVIYDAQLWLQRTKDGKPAHKSFDAFVHHELGGFSKTTSYWLMDIAEAFNEQEVLLYGKSKLALLLKAPKEDRSILLDKVKAGLKGSALTEAVNKSREEKGQYVRDTPRTTDSLGRDQSAQRAGVSKKAKDGKKAKARGDSITVAKILGRQQVKLWARSEKKGAEPTKRARKLGDKPCGALDFENGVQMHFGITTSSAGDWILVVETKRPEA
jgi:hypothetical protein